MTTDGATFDYSFFATEDGFGMHDASMNPFVTPGDGTSPPSPVPSLDGRVPWEMLLSGARGLDAWTAIADSTEPSQVNPSHPLAATAWSDGDTLLEVSTDGVPMLVRTSETDFQVTGLQMRPVRSGEIGNNLDLPFAYALYLAKTTTPEQRSVLSDGDCHVCRL